MIKKFIALFCLISIFYPAFSFADIGSETIFITRISDDVAPGDLFTVYGYNLNNAELYAADSSSAPFKIDVINHDMRGNYLTARLPKEKSAGCYLIWAEKGEDFSGQKILNAPRPQWLSESAAAENQIVSIYGRGLSPFEYGSDNSVSVRLTNPQNTIPIDATGISPFEIVFSIPENTPIGQYEVEVNVGFGIWHGLEYTEFTPYLEIVPPVTDPLNLGVWWAGEFNWSNIVYPAATPNDGISDADAINTAIRSASNAGGGVVMLSSGVYELGSTSLRIRNGVVLRGAGKDSTILRTSGAWQVIETTGSPTGLMGVADLNIEFYQSVPDKRVPDAFINLGGATVSRGFVVNVKTVAPPTRRRYENSSLDDGRGFGLMTSASSDMLLRGCEFNSYAAMWLDVKKHMRIADNIFNLSAGCIYSIGVCQIITDNEIYINTPPGETSEYNSEGVITRGPSFVANNHISGAGRENHNDGETIMTENAGKQTMFFGNVTSAAGTEIIVDPLYDKNWTFGSSAWGNWHIVITDGKGLGQYRSIIGSDKENLSLTVDSEWEIVPDNTSRFTIIMPAKGITIYNNYAENSAKGYWFYNDVLDGVIYGNISINTEGVMNHAYAHDRSNSQEFAVIYFNRLEKNVVSGVSTKSGISAIGEIVKIELNTEAGYTPKMIDVFGLSSYGTEILKNDFTGDPNHTTHNNQTSEAPDICGIYYSQMNRVNITRPCSEAAIIQGNVVRNSERGITIGGGVYPSEWFDSMSEFSVALSGVVAADNSFTNVKRSYISTLGAEYAKQITGDTITGVIPKLYKNSQQVSSLSTGNFKISLQVKSLAESENTYTLYAVMMDGDIIKSIKAEKQEIAAGGEETIEIPFTITPAEAGYKLMMLIWKDNLEPVNAVTYYQ